MSGKVTLLAAENQTLSTGSVLCGFQTAAVNSLAANVKVKRLEISQSGSTTLAMIRGQIATRDSAGTLTMTAQAPVNTRPVGGPASGLAGNTNILGGVARSGIISSADSGGTYTQVHPFNFANTAGYLLKPDSEYEELWFQPSTIVVVRFLAAPGTLTGWTFALYLVEE
jgi:hypothetical protein